MQKASFTPGPWHVNDLRAARMRELGWTGQSVDVILIQDRSPAQIAATENGNNSVIARISFDNRPEELGEGNLKDACLIAAAPEMYETLKIVADILIHLLTKGEFSEETAPAIRSLEGRACKVLARAEGRRVI